MFIILGLNPLRLDFEFSFFTSVLFRDWKIENDDVMLLLMIERLEVLFDFLERDLWKYREGLCEFARDLLLFGMEVIDPVWVRFLGVWNFLNLELPKMNLLL